jgi:maleate cis-trans isomerase
VSDRQNTLRNTSGSEFGRNQPRKREDQTLAYTLWRGVVGLVKPTRRPGSLEELIRLLPDGIGVVPLLLNIREGNMREFKAALAHYKTCVGELAEQGVDLIRVGGTPPFMRLGYKGEADLIRRWEKEYKTPIVTDGQTHTAALRALGIKKFIGASYSALQNKIVIDYMRQAGFTVVSMEPIDVPFDQVGQIAPQEVYAHIRRLFLAHPGADGIYIQGGGWRTSGIVEMLERDLQVPVVHATICQSWEIQKRLHVRQPITGYGRLVRELP